MGRRNLLTFCLLLAIIAWPTSALALTIPLDNEFGQDLPGTFGEVILTDVGNNIEFDISVSDPLGGTTADLLAFYFNIDPDFLPTSDISFVFTTPSSFTPADSIDYTASNTANKPDGDGFFNIVLDYTGDTTEDVAGCGGQGCLQHVVFEVAVTIDSVAQDLAIEYFGSFPPDPDTQSVGGAKGHFTVAVRLNRIDTDGEDSAWVGGNPVPEPTTALLLGSGLLGLLGLSRKRFLKKS